MVLERTISLPGGVVVSKRSGGDVWSYPNVHGDVQAVADGVGVKQSSTLLCGPFGSPVGHYGYEDLGSGFRRDNQVGEADLNWLGSHQRLNEHAEPAGLLHQVRWVRGLPTVPWRATRSTSGWGRKLHTSADETVNVNVR